MEFGENWVYVLSYRRHERVHSRSSGLARVLRIGETRAKLDQIRAILREEYESPNGLPWIVAYSGGKDSTLLLQLVFEVMLDLPPSKRTRRVHVIANDTLVESPLVIGHLKNSMAAIRNAVGKFGLPVTATITQPCIDQTFWVNVIGRGYIPPTRSFRWCTDRMKIAPANSLIRNIARANDGAVLLIGTRKSESTARRNRMTRREESGERMNPHDSIRKCLMFPPLADLTDNECGRFSCNLARLGAELTVTLSPYTATPGAANARPFFPKATSRLAGRLRLASGAGLAPLSQKTGAWKGWLIRDSTNWSPCWNSASCWSICASRTGPE